MFSAIGINSMEVPREMGDMHARQIVVLIFYVWEMKFSTEGFFYTSGLKYFLFKIY
jgi:hypothetical protein